VIEDLIAAPGALEAQRIVVRPGGGSEGAYSHPGEEFVYVLAGELTFWLDERRRFLLTGGDSLAFRSTRPHRWRNDGAVPATLLWINAPLVAAADGEAGGRDAVGRRRPAIAAQGTAGSDALAVGSERAEAEARRRWGGARGMRVIAGDRRGFKLHGPAGPGTRPMADKIKGALFSVLASLDVVPDRVLDLYAGTGSLGIEALSRGAEWADFVEQNGAAAAVVRANLAHTKFAEQARVHQQPVLGFLRQAGRRAAVDGPYDLVLMDPPYADPAIVSTLTMVGASPLVQSGAVVVVGHSPRVALPERVGRLRRLRERCHGDSCFSVYDVGEDAGDADGDEAGEGADGGAAGREPGSGPGAGGGDVARTLEG
jgi:16S rRNA (guanine966-N2)-methyltransferase